MNKPISGIQLACQQDVPELVSLLNACAIHMHQNGMSHWLEVYDHAAVAENIEQKSVFILRENTNLLGCVALGTQPAAYYAECWPEAPDADFYLTQLAVHPEYQQSGYGKLLLQHCLSLIGQRTLLLDAVAHYPELLNFYRKSGFRNIAQGIGLGDQRLLFEYMHSSQ